MLNGLRSRAGRVSCRRYISVERPSVGTLPVMPRSIVMGIDRDGAHL